MMAYPNEIVVSDSPASIAPPLPLMLPEPDFFDDLFIDDYYAHFVPYVFFLVFNIFPF